MAVEIITAKTGEPHVDSEDVGAFNANTIGAGSYLLDGLTMTITDANTLHVGAAEILFEGRHVRIKGNGEDIAIANGTTGYSRNDLLVLKYEKDSENGDLESIALELITGTPTTGTPADPTVATGSILAGDTLAYLKLARVVVTNLTPAAPVKLIGSFGSNTVELDSRMTTAEKNITSLNSSKVPTTRTVNNKALSSNITLAASDVGAVPTSRTVNGKALSSNITLAASNIALTNGTTLQSAVTTLQSSVADSGWKTASVDGGSGNCCYRKVGGIVVVKLEYVKATNSWVTKFTLPTGYRPTKTMYGAMFYLAANNQNGGVRITTGGVVATYGNMDQAYWAGSIAFPV